MNVERQIANNCMDPNNPEQKASLAPLASLAALGILAEGHIGLGGLLGGFQRNTYEKTTVAYAHLSRFIILWYLLLWHRVAQSYKAHS